MREIAAKIIKANAGGILGLFVSPDKIYNSLTENLLKYLENEDNHQVLCEKFGGLIDSFLDKDTHWLRAKIKEEDLDRWFFAAFCGLQKNLCKDHVDKIFDWLADKLEQLRSTDLREILPPVEGLAEKTAGGLLAIVPGEIVTNSEDFALAIGKMARKLAVALMEKAAEYVVGPLNIAEIVEEKINAMEIKETESLVLSVVGKQLRWIALLGGLLGFVIGFLPVIFG
jgi:uncharacterized membrane-anchored protein YjiN (DUF445 family)